MIQIRRGIFETNSSSVHSLILCSDKEWKKFKEGELVADTDEEKLLKFKDIDNHRLQVAIERFENNGNHWNPKVDIDADEYSKPSERLQEEYILPYSYMFGDWDDDFSISFNTFHKKYTSSSGDVIHAFGYYGHD